MTIFPSNGVVFSQAAAGATATVNTTNCDVLWLPNNCAYSIMPSTINSLISEIVNAVNSAGVAYDCSSTANLSGVFSTVSTAAFQASTDATTAINLTNTFATDIATANTNATTALNTANSFATDIAALQVAVAGNDTDIAALQTAVAAAQACCDTNTTAVAALQTADTNLQTQITNNDTDIAALQTADTNLQTQITNKDTHITALQTADTNLQTQITANDADILQLQTDLQNHINALEYGNVVNNVAQNIPANTWSKFFFNTVNQSGTAWDNATAVWTAPVDGMYEFTVTFTGDGGGVASWGLGLRVNGVNVNFDFDQNINTAVESMRFNTKSMTVKFNVAAGTTIEPIVIQGNATTTVRGQPADGSTFSWQRLDVE